MNTNNKYNIAVFEENDNADLIEYSEKMKESIETALNNNKGEQGETGPAPIKGTDYFTNEEIQEIESNVLDRVNQFSVEVVEVLPSENISEHTIYFVPQKNAKQQDVYDEYMFINENWEHIGTTEVDLSNYYNKKEVDEKVEGGIGDLVVNYKNSTITAPTIQGFGKIHKLYGKTEETGEGEKSPSNPYEISCVADNINLFDKDKLQIASAWQSTYSLNSDKILTVNSTATSGVAFVKTNNFDLRAGTYTFSADIGGAFQEVRISKSDGTRIKTISTRSDSFVVEEDTQIYFEFYVWATSTSNTMNIKNIQIEKGIEATAYREYGEGLIKITSTDETNTSNKVINCKPLCCLKDDEGNIVAQDYIDFDRQKIVRKCGYLVLNGTENWEISTAYTNDTYLCAYAISDFNTSKIITTDRFVSGFYTEIRDKECLGSDTFNAFNIQILKSRLKTKDIAGLKEWLSSNNVTVVYKIDTSYEEDIDITNSIVQYQNETTVSNSDNAEMEIELTNNKAISSINKNIAELQEKDKEFIKKENILLKECKLLGTANNTDTTITLSDDKLSNYKFIAVSSGYFSNKSTTLIPVILFKILDGFNVCRQYVKTYNGYGWTSVQYINDTSFKIYGAVKEMANGSVGTDTITQVYGIK